MPILLLLFLFSCNLSHFSPIVSIFSICQMLCNPCHVSILSDHPPCLLLPSTRCFPPPSLQIQFGSHSLSGLNHQDRLEEPKHESVSPQRGFCLLTVETSDLHALCLWSVPQHLEAVEVITVICLTGRRLHTVTRRPSHLLLCFICRHSCRVALNT